MHRFYTRIENGIHMPTQHTRKTTAELEWIRGVDGCMVSY